MGERDSPKPTAGISAPVLSLNFVAAMFVLQKRVYSLVVCVLDRLSGYRTTGAIQVHTRSSKKKRDTRPPPCRARSLGHPLVILFSSPAPSPPPPPCPPHALPPSGLRRNLGARAAPATTTSSRSREDLPLLSLPGRRDRNGLPPPRASQQEQVARRRARKIQPRRIKTVAGAAA